jgi:Lsr2
VARRVVQHLVDDIDGGKAVEEVRFSYQGVDYEIDLSARNAKALDKAVSPYVNAARRVGGRRSGSRRPAGTSSSRGPESREVREWATRQGIKVSARGRIPADVMRHYQEAHGG